MINKKILGFMNAYSSGISGGDISFIEICKRFKGCNVTVVTSYLGYIVSQKYGLKTNYIITSREKSFRYPVIIYIIRIFLVLMKWKKINKVDIVVSSSDFLPDVLPAFLLKLFKPRVVWIQHIFHLIPRHRLLPFLGQRMSFLFIKWYTDKIIVDNRQLEKELIKLNFVNEKVEVNYLGIDPTHLNKIRKNKQIEYEGIYLGRIHKSKGVIELIDIWRIVCSKKPNNKLIIVGAGDDNSEKELIKKILSNKLINNVEYIGFLNHEEALMIINKSKLFIFPSKEEGFGIAPLEAQALGLPVIAWDLSLYDEIFPMGMVKTKIGDLNQFADGIHKLLDEPKLYKKLSEEAIINSRKYSWNKFFEKEIDIINRLDT